MLPQRFESADWMVRLRHRPSGYRALAAVLAFGACSFLPASANAQQLSRTLGVSADNDFFNFWIPPRQRSDDNYSHGMRLAWNPSAVPKLERTVLCSSGDACGWKLEIGQEMYTPTVDTPVPLPGQRPYAGWLYGRIAVGSGNDRTFRNIGITAGVTGPASLAETVQESFHKQFGFRRPLGWKYQLATEPAFAITAGQSWRIAPKDAAHFVDFVPVGSVSLGTLRTSASAAGRILVGTNLEHPWMAARSRSRLALQLFLGGKIEAVAHDLFLDGNTFERSIHVDAKWNRSEWERGFRIGIGRVTMEYGVTTQSREYTTGPPGHTYSSLGLSWALN